MRRHLLGILGLALVVGGIAGSLAGGGSFNDIGLVPSSCIRVGCVLGALWLAFPQLLEIGSRVPPWLIGAVLVGGLAVAIRPRSIAVVAPLVAALIGLQFLGRLLRPPER
jgi:hypothetical protein